MQAADEFRNAIEQAGLSPPDTILSDGKLHRFASNGDRDDDAGWYVLHCDGIPAGCFGDWRSDFKQTWCSRSHGPMTEQERQEYGRRIESAQRQREVEEHQRHAEAAAHARTIWGAAPLAPSNHPYLQRKQVQPHGLRLDHDGDLIVPIFIDSQLASLQGIAATDGQKIFLPGGQVKGGSFTLGDLRDANTIIIAEGIATAASLHEATGYPTICAFFAGNLLPVAQALRSQFPSAVIVLGGDNDIRDDGKPNAGLDAATKAAQAITGIVTVPEAINNRKTDWNDVHVHLGLETVRGAIEAVLPRPRETEATETVCTDREPGLTKALADDILRTKHFAKDAGGQLYVFEDGCYRPHGEPCIAQRVKALLLANGDTKHWSSHRAREVTEYIKVDIPPLWDRPKPEIVNLANGLFSLATGTLTPHTPSHLCPVQLPVTFDPWAICPLWESFTARVLPSDCQTLPFEVVASAMRGEITDQTAALLVGSGDNGKSTLLEGVISFLGRENVSTLALQRLEADKFAVVRLLGKLANVCADLPSDALAGTSTFKALTGGDRLTAERKFQGSFEFSPFARLLFSTNHYPTSKDASQAFFRRWIVIPFDAVLEEREKIENFAAQLASPGELSGVLNRALSALPGMSQRRGFSQSESTRAALMEFREMTDPLAAWLDHNTTLIPDSMVTKKDLLISFNGMAEAHGRPPMSPKAFYAGVKRLRPTIKEAQRTVREGVKDVFLGIGLRTSHATAPASASSDGLFTEDVLHDDR